MVGRDQTATAEAIRVFVRVRPHRVELGETIGRWTYDEHDIDDLEDNREQYSFPRVYMQDSSTETIYKEQISFLLEEVIQGFNGTVFAYGQTGAGKTHTILGNESMPGLMPQAIEELFDAMKTESDRAYFVSVSYLEIYKEELRDLLVKNPTSGKTLKIIEGKKGPYVPGTREPYVANAEEAMTLIMEGQKARQVGATKMNIVSSRSHTIFRVHVESRALPDGQVGGIKHAADLPAFQTAGKKAGSVRLSTLSFVDLAGSERLSKTEATGNRAKEGVMINKSLLTLGLVINVLSGGEGANKGGKMHIPYRDSNLTRLLQPALGGNSKCVNVCCVHIADQHTEETHSTLRFAMRAKQIVNKATLNETETPEAAVLRLKKEAEELKAMLASGSNDEVEKLRDELMKQKKAVVQARFKMAAQTFGRGTFNNGSSTAAAAAAAAGSAGSAAAAAAGSAAAAAPADAATSARVAELEEEVKRLEVENATIAAEKQVADKERTELIAKFEDLTETYEEQSEHNMHVAEQILADDKEKSEQIAELREELKRFVEYHEQDKETINRMSEAADAAEKEIAQLKGIADIDETKGEDGSWLNWQRWREAERSRVAACKQRDDAEHAARIFKDKMMEEVEKNIVMQRELEKLRESYGVSVNRTMSMQSGKSSGLLACLGFERVQ